MTETTTANKTISLRVTEEVRQKIRDITYKNNETMKALIERLIIAEHMKIKDSK